MRRVRCPSRRSNSEARPSTPAERNACAHPGTSASFEQNCVHVASRVLSPVIRSTCCTVRSRAHVTTCWSAVPGKKSAEKILRLWPVFTARRSVGVPPPPQSHTHTRQSSLPEMSSEPLSFQLSVFTQPVCSSLRVQ